MTGWGPQCGGFLGWDLALGKGEEFRGGVRESGALRSGGTWLWVEGG